MESAVIALCVAVAFCLGFLFKGNNNTREPPKATSEVPVKPETVSKAELVRKYQNKNFFNYNGSEMPDPTEQADKIIYGVSREND